MKYFASIIFALACVGPGHAGEKTFPPISLSDFKLVGELTNGQANFTLTGNLRVENPKGGQLELLSGHVALTELGQHTGWTIRPEANRYVAVFERRGTYPVHLTFAAPVEQRDGWNQVDFQVAPSSLQTVLLNGLSADTEFDFQGAARPESSGTGFKSYLPSDGKVKLAWKEARPESEGKLFYSAEMLSQITVGPGLMRQVAWLDFKVMQGELDHIALLLRGEGEVTRVQGEHILAWKVEPLPASKERRLVVQFNQSQKDQFALEVDMQTSLGAFPQATDALSLRAEGATRFTGYFRIVNEGAVRLGVLKAAGMSQVSPDQFPETEASRAALRPAGSQRFVYRFSGSDSTLRIQADQVEPELGISELLVYRLGENELEIEGELELEIREAPLREITLRVPKGYSVARVNAPLLADYFLAEPEGKAQAELRLIFSQPLTGHQIVELRFEHNKPLGEATWNLPRIEVANAKTVRGHLAISADTGFRITPQRTDGLTEVATAFFPRKVPGIQTAFRLSDLTWQAAVRVERIPQTVQADAFHLFSIGEGIAYGSSLINYVVSGAPIGVLKIQLSKEYFNVEFTGKDIRGWQQTDEGYLVQLQTPVSGAYTLLATYERPFKAQGDVLTFTGARPSDAPSEQGHTLIVSSYQFQVRPVEISAGLLPLETGEVPPEYRLFFDAPILAAYRYVARPFNLRLALTPLAQGDSLNQVVDRAWFNTRISKEGQLLTDARYYIKSRGNPNFRLSLPKGTELWSAVVNGTKVVPVLDGSTNLIPLPRGGDPSAVISLDFKLASKARDPNHIEISAPTVSSPVMLAEWKLEPDSGQRLAYRGGSLLPVGGVSEPSGFGGLARMFKGDQAGQVIAWLIATGGLLVSGLGAWRWVSLGSHAKLLPRTAGIVLGGIAIVVSSLCFLAVLRLAAEQSVSPPRELRFLAPIQQADSSQTLHVSNTYEKMAALEVVGYVWPGLLAVPLWLYGWLGPRHALQKSCQLAGWTVLAWAALRWPNGAPAFLGIVAAFVAIHAVIPALIQLGKLRPQLNSGSTPDAVGGVGSSAATAVWVGGMIWISASLLGTGSLCSAGEANMTGARPAERSGTTAIPDSVLQDVRVEGDFAFGTARIRWRTEKGETLPLLFEPGVLTAIDYPTNALRLTRGLTPRFGWEEGSATNYAQAQVLLAQRRGIYDITLRYEARVTQKHSTPGLVLPVSSGIVNSLHLAIMNTEVEVFSPQAVSITRAESGTNTVAVLALTPAADTWIGWKPRSRDLKGERPVFYADVSHLYVPAAGVVEGAHMISVRPAQGELRELTLDIPAGASITDVSEPPGGPAQNSNQVAQTPLVSLWRFDPDTRKLRVTFSRPQSRPFGLIVRSEFAAGALPFERSVGVVVVTGAAEQIGLLGFGTGSDVQLDSVEAQRLSPINLEDFPGGLATVLQPQFSGLMVRRAFRYANVQPVATLKASAVDPDVRVDAQSTVSLGEDRTVLAVTAAVDITRAGIFRMSFVLPQGYDVESISGSALSHWTELKSEAGRVITLHLNGKTEGKQQFTITLSGAGVKAANSWVVPQLVLKEATKQTGTVLVVPEQGFRLQVRLAEGATQLDPQKSGIKQKGVLAFRVLQTPPTLSLDIERVDPWIQVSSLQQATLSEAQIQVGASLLYQIENTGLKAFRVFIPTNAEAVRFDGEQVADYLAESAGSTNSLQAWVIKLHRRVIGQYLLHVSYQLPLSRQESSVVLRGVQVAEVNAQRGFVTVQSGGRLQVGIDSIPSSLQPAEWQSIPRTLQQGLAASAANFTYRIVETAFELPLRVERHEAAKLLPARVNGISFNSVISDDGVMLTQVRLEILPGDKRLLSLTLPKGARFWFAFVNGNGVWPWREQDRILLPLEQASHGDKPMPVELFYSCQVKSPGVRAIDLDLLAPKFDLPLENLTWRVALDRKWKIQKCSGALQLEGEEVVGAPTGVEVQTYLQTEVAQQRERTKQAEEMLASGNSALAQGEPLQARRAFQAAYGLSSHDAAFNEDARVQLHNIKLQQALIGLNVRQATSGGETGTLGGKLRELRSHKELNYTQQDAKDILERNSADDNALYLRLAERLIQQQDAAVSSPTALRANIPDQGRILSFKRAVVIDPWADLQIRLRATESVVAGPLFRVWVLLGTLVFFAALAWITRAANRAPSRQS